jgi:hypothetical protein
MQKLPMRDLEEERRLRAIDDRSVRVGGYSFLFMGWGGLVDREKTKEKPVGAAEKKKARCASNLLTDNKTFSFCFSLPQSQKHILLSKL